MDISNSIYKIITASGSGTGFFIDGFTYMITNYHVVAGNKSVAIESIDLRRYLGAVVFVDPIIDMAFIKIDESNPIHRVPEIKINNLLEIKRRQQVFIHGFPFGMPYTVTEGIISNPMQLMNNQHFVQTDAAVNPGNSGGPILNEHNELIAITTSKFTNADNVGFGIPYGEIIENFNDFTPNGNIYHVKCNSCSNLIVEPTEFCENCGNEIDLSYFEDFQLSNMAIFVENALQDLGINPILARASREYWEFYHGSAKINIFVYNHDYLLAVSPLNKLPKENLEELYEYILKQPKPPYYFGISDNEIYISYRVHLSDLFSKRAAEIKADITGLGKTANEMDTFFKEKFKCDYSMESKNIINKHST